MSDHVNASDAGFTHGVRSTTVARSWEEALVTGNGTQGALCFGDAAALRITLSHERLFLPVTAPLPAPETARILPELRALLETGHGALAARRVCELAEAEHPGFAATRWIDPLVGAATLAFDSGRTMVSHDRMVDFRSGLVTLRGGDPAGGLIHQIFVSRPANLVVLCCRATPPEPSAQGGSPAGPLDGVFRLVPIAGKPPVPIAVLSSIEPDRLVMTASFPDRWPGTISGYTVTCHVVAEGPEASLAPEGDGLRCRGAREVLVLARVEVLAASGTADAAGPAGPAFDDCVAGLPAGISAAVAALLSDHAAVTAARFDQVRLSLAAGGRAPNHGRDHARDRGSPTSEELLAEPGSPRLTERLFDAGRYAILSSTGALPPTLQGVWSGDYDPPWRSGYTLNGNLPTALALAVPTGQPDLLLPLFDLLDQMMDDFRENARRLYGARGILLPTHCSSHGKQNHFGPIWCQTFWTAAAAWMARFYFDYWRATGDSAFLAERALPFMVEAASFYEDFLVERGGHTAFIPSYSPENEPAGTGTQAAINATLDVAAVRDLFRNLIECQSALNQNDPRLTHWRTVLESLPRFATGANGELAEWVWAGLLDNHAHRHASHLYPLWYADPDLLADPALCAAAAATIQRRLAWWRGDATGIEQPGEMAFGLVGLGLAAARLGLADVAFEILGKLEQDYWRPSLVSTHNAGSIFNVDLCGGFVALVLSMLISTGRETIDLLPAVPSAWQRGEITGIAGCDQVTVTRLSWTPEHVEVELAAAVERRIMIGFASTPATHRRVPVTVRPGQPLHLVASRQPASTGVTPDCDIP